MAKSNPYLNNQLLLDQIHKSKISYCSYLDPTYTRCDLIVESLDEVTDELLDEAIAKRRAKEQRQLRSEYTERTGKRTGKEFNAIRAPEYQREDMVVRVITFEHIPLLPEPRNVQCKRPEAKLRVRINFTPFKHYVMIDGQYVEVLRSHWIGGFDNGHFSQTHGKTTDKLGRAYLLLASRYSGKSNFRGYTYREEMVGHAIMKLAEHGLQFDEDTTNNPFAYLTRVTHNSFLHILNSEKKEQDRRDSMREKAGLQPSTARQLKNEGW